MLGCGRLACVPLLYPQVAALLQVNPPWVGFDACAFEVHVLTLDEVLDRFATCWGTGSEPPGSMTLDQYLAATGGPNPKVADIAQNFRLDVPVLALTFSLNVLSALWPTAYSRAGATRVIIDGNHRLAALAVRRAQGVRDSIVVGAFTCDR